MKSTAPTATYPQSPADKAAHLAARGPIRVHGKARIQDEIEDAYAERDRQLAEAVAMETAAAKPKAKANWIPKVAPAEPKRTIPTDVIDGMWDAVMDGYSLPSAA